MQFLNPAVEADLASGRVIRLELGSGGRAERPGFYSLDKLPLEGVDIVADLDSPLAELPNDCADYIFTSHTLEHVHQLLPLVREVFRLLRPGGTFEILVPHFSNPYYYSDPTHVRFFGLYSMYYFVAPESQPEFRRVPAYYSDVRFVVRQIRLTFYRRSVFDRIVYPVLKRLVNRSLQWQDFYERRICRLVHAADVRYVLQSAKEV